MAFEATIIKDSIFQNGVRVTTAKLSFPRSLLAEFNTHRMLSRNAASSRAIPVSKMIEQIENDPFIPEFTKNKKGMQGTEPLDEVESKQAKIHWTGVANSAVSASRVLSGREELNIHKQFTNRLLEPWMWATVVVTATDWINFFAQRTHKDAEPSFQKVALMFREAYEASVPRVLERFGPFDRDTGEPRFWHLPFFNCSEEDNSQIEPLTYEDVYVYLLDRLGSDFEKVAGTAYSKWRFEERLFQDISVGRLAKLSYNNIETGKVDVLNDIRLAVQLSIANPGHWSPFEHVCREAYAHEMVYDMNQLEVYWVEGSLSPHTAHIRPKQGELGYCGNFKGAFQYRKEFLFENITSYQEGGI